MRLLLDTHTFIWWDSEPAKLSPQVLALCQDRQNFLLLSVASVWERQIKLQLVIVSNDPMFPKYTDKTLW